MELKEFFELIKFVLPSVVMLIAITYIVGGYFRDSEKRQKMEIIRANQNTTTPLRLQAYERLTLLLERISPEALLLRSPNYPAKTNDALQSELINNIRIEFEHNLSQQLYVSQEAWNSVKNAKNYTIMLINNAAKELNGDAPAAQLSRKLLDMSQELEKPITDMALNEIKREIQQFF